ncbi:MAG: MmgE/PrpD family protein [Burkholderiales bacterium]
MAAVPHVPPAPAEVSAALAAFISTARHRALPSAVTAATQRAFANWMACALGATGDHDVAAALQVASALGGAAQASIIGRSGQLDVVNAALVNAIAANALDYDDMHVPTLIHPTGAVVAAALALGESRRVPGAVLLAAVATGIEVECRLGLALFPQHYDQGWHSTATLGTLGAAAAGAVVLGLDAARTAHALGMAATQAGGLRAMLSNPCKSFNIGKAAAAGVIAVLFAEAGFDSEPRVLEAKFGLFDVFGWPAEPAAIARELGTRYLTDEVSLKPYPCGVVIHPVIDACLALAQAHDLAPGQLRKITITVHPRTIELAGRQHPESAITGRFSFFHAAALAFVKRSAGLAVFEAADVNDPALAALRGRMTGVADPALQPRQARVRIELEDGRAFEQAIDHPSGSPARPLTDAQLQAKFLELAARAAPARGRELFEACLHLERLPDVADLRRYWAV